MQTELNGLKAALDTIMNRMQPLHKNQLYVEDMSLYAQDRLAGILNYYAVIERGRYWRNRFRLRIIPYFSDNPISERRRTLSFIVYDGRPEIQQVVNEELNRFAETFGFKATLDIQAGLQLD